MPEASHASYRQALEFAERQVAALVANHPDFFPMYTVGGKWHHGGESWTDWTGGFLVGMMWAFDDGSGNPEWRARAEHYCRLLELRQVDRNVHDLGFLFLNSYWPWYQRTGDEAAKAVLIQAGRTLSKRFIETGKYLCSFVGLDSLFVDIMMNVPLLLVAADLAGDESLRNVALAHCRTTRDRLVRADGSTAHEGLFNLLTGEFLRQSTHQGLSAESTWARGLAWSMYGFTQVYELTGMDEFLKVAQRNAEYWLAHLPEDKVPYWDFNADLSQPPPWGAMKDSSAGAIAASALLDLARQAESPDNSVVYHNAALATLDALLDPKYLAVDTPGWEGVLKHGVYHTKRDLGVDESVIWGDFFFVEALTKVI
ncbi:MAG: glycoside hydrolase family 88 protein [Pirellulales bacterium]|nr:glycoside hydrolase family 88 protein [Pirellulales bacterium]